MVSDEKIFSCFHYISLCKHVTLGVGHFWPKGYKLNKFSESLLGDASYQISRLYALWFQIRRYFNVSPYISLCKICDPSAGPLLPPVALVEQTWSRSTR